MEIPANRLAILILLWRYVILRAAQIRDRILPNDRSAALTRAHLRKLVASGLVRKYQPRIVDPLGNGVAAPVYMLTLKGGSMLAAVTGDTRYILRGEPNLSSWMSVPHWTSLAALAMIIDDAIAGQDYVKLTAMHFEHEVANADATDPAERYLTYLRVSPKLVFVPDAAIETEVRGYRRAGFIEYETGSDSPARVAAKKHGAVAALGKKYEDVFPLARDFRVLAFCPNAGWRDALRKEFKNKPGKHLWLFCATQDAKKETFLHEPIFFEAEKETPIPLIPKRT